MPQCGECGLFFPPEERFCGHDGSVLLENSQTPSETNSSMVGQMVGTYRLEKKIGEGGMGSVYEAVHPVVNRRIAMKVVHPHYAKNPVVVARFFDEARALGKIRHPNIVRVYDLGQLDDQTIFLAMELLSGKDLRTFFQKGALSTEKIYQIFPQIAKGLQAAHHAGIIHRDLKPENIFICDNNTVKILDFGVVKLTDSAEGFSRTHTGMIVGTPEYMSPEQAAGKRDFDHRSDIYSFGLLLYEALAGCRPFEANTLFEILSQHVQSEFPSPSERVGHSIDASLEAMTKTCLAKNPENRFVSMENVIDAFERTNKEKSKEISLEDTKQIPKLKTNPSKEKKKPSLPPLIQNFPFRKVIFLTIACLIVGVALSAKALLFPSVAPSPSLAGETEKIVVQESSFETLLSYFSEDIKLLIDFDLSVKTKETLLDEIFFYENSLESLFSQIDTNKLTRVTLGLSKISQNLNLEAVLLVGEITPSQLEQWLTIQKNQKPKHWSFERTSQNTLRLTFSTKNLQKEWFLQTVPGGMLLTTSRPQEGPPKMVARPVEVQIFQALPKKPVRAVFSDGAWLKTLNIFSLSSYTQILPKAVGMALDLSENNSSPKLHFLFQLQNPVQAWDLQGFLAAKEIQLQNANWKTTEHTLEGNTRWEGNKLPL